MIAAAHSRTVRAVVISDTSAQPALLEALLGDGDIVVVAELTSAADASGVVARSRPDIVILDLQLDPDERQDVIEQIMAHAPTPILTLSADDTSASASSPARALVAGAVAELPRPDRWTSDGGAELRHSVRQISTVQVIRHLRGGLVKPPKRGAPPLARRPPVVAVGASTGGPSALAILLSGLAGLAAPVLVVQHLHPDFTGGLVKWMSRVAALPVETARHGEFACAGRIYVAPGGFHLRYGATGRLELDEAPATVHRPSADELFGSVAEHAGSAGIGVLLTGMGDDGAKGLLAIHQRGGRTLAQDEASSAVFGMPKAAERLGAVTRLLPLDDLAAGIQRAVREVHG